MIKNIIKNVEKLVQPAHKRINEQLLGYWEQKKGSRQYPMESDINPDEIENIWESCFLVQIEEDGSYRYTYLGHSLIEAYGDDLNNKEVCEKLIYPTSMSLTHKFDEVRSEMRPVIEDSEFTNTRGMLIKFRSCMLPLGKSGVNGVAYILGGMKWKAF